MSEQVVAELRDTLIQGEVKKSAELTKSALAQGVAIKTLITDGIKAAADVVGEKYDCGEYFLANLVRCGGSFKAAIDEIEGHRKTRPEAVADGKPVVVATVQGDIHAIGKNLVVTFLRGDGVAAVGAPGEGDIHDIGKNLVVTFLRGDGFAVEDVGVDVPAAQVVDKAVEAKADSIARACLRS